jgi:hypothetical protein
MQARLSFPQSSQHQTDLQSMLMRVSIIQTIATGLCDFIAQCIMVRINHYTYHPFSYSPSKSSKIYRCWILWGRNIRVVMIPLFLAIAYLGQSIRVYLYLISQFQFIASSSLARVTRRRNIRTRPIFSCSLV